VASWVGRGSIWRLTSGGCIEGRRPWRTSPGSAGSGVQDLVAQCWSPAVSRMVACWAQQVALASWDSLIRIAGRPVDDLPGVPVLQGSPDGEIRPAASCVAGTAGSDWRHTSDGCTERRRPCTPGSPGSGVQDLLALATPDRRGWESKICSPVGVGDSRAPFPSTQRYRALHRCSPHRRSSAWWGMCPVRRRHLERVWAMWGASASPQAHTR
jgi:hypothetical protein